MIRNKFTVSDISKVFPIVTNFTSNKIPLIFLKSPRLKIL